MVQRIISHSIPCHKYGNQQTGWVCLCSIWLARSKSRVGSCGFSEGFGHLDPRVGGNALGWFHRAAITPRYRQWKDNKPKLIRLACHLFFVGAQVLDAGLTRQNIASIHQIISFLCQRYGYCGHTFRHLG
ncbi:hypothetical protein CTI12_AA625370 [Artemisia annua]|uniref:Uncharacterized protein n=1 Tax=Artemisia annua TaxID=35608 RepID=A0A2U1KAI4_ARTAN|nr:hypothetical protein CTI12_AA625370 [Artemisia annua]